MRNTIFIGLMLLYTLIRAQPGTITEHIKIDQFGYPTDVSKYAIVNNPTAGFDFDMNDFYTPGSTFKVCKAGNDSIVFSGAVTSWHNGATYDQSGDVVWWFDFSAVTTPDSYYIYDPVNDNHSFTFEIADDVYKDVLKHSVRMFFYQRSGFEKEVEYAYDWSDGASHLGPLQDLDCRLATNPVSSTAKQLQGGWFDAGDYNKYVNFAYEPVHDLCLSYIERPEIWTDDYNIPESGNGIPDLLDEVKWEMDWLLRMQETNGSVLMKVSVPDWSAASPPSADTTPRRYGTAQASATRTAASMYSMAALAFNLCGHPGMALYADTLEEAAVDAWNWLEDNPAYSNYSNAGFFSANPEMNAYQQLSAQTGAAILLFALTGETKYRDYLDDHYDEMHPIQWGYWYAWESIIQDLMLYYSMLPNATTSVKNAIRNSFSGSMANSNHLLPAITNSSCAYRGFMNDGDNVWGSNRPRGHTGAMFYNVITYGINADTQIYRNAAMGYANFLHGVNPISRVMLTNMYAFGAEKSANEMYHSWFADGTDYDNALTSLYGPAPGYQPGGFNPNFQPDPAYGGNIIPPQQQPSLKSYKDWNTSWPENSWEITETSISNQGSYVKLLSKFVPIPCITTVTNVYDVGHGTLRQAVACAQSGDTIFFNVQAGDTLTVSNETLVIDKSISLFNLNTGYTEVFCDIIGIGISVMPGVNVHVHDLSFSGSGTGIIRNEGTLHLHDVRFNPDGVSSFVLTNEHEALIYGEVNIQE